MRVRLFESLNQLKVSGFGLAFEAGTDIEIPLALPRLQKAKIQKVANGFKIQLTSSKEELFLSGPELKLLGEMVKINGKSVPNNTSLVARGRARLDVVASLPLEKYLEGVLPSEMPGGWPLEALKAQAVASRTYTLKVMERRRGKSFHLESTVEDQVYNHLNITGARAAIRKKIKRALKETEGQVLKRQGKIFTTYYHADCGGQTEEPHRVWGNAEKNGTVKDLACPLSPHGDWQMEFKENWLSERLKTFFQFEPNEKFEKLLVAARSPSGRVQKLEAHFYGKAPQTMSSQELRRLMGFRKIKSTNFHMHWSDGKLVVHGRGHGHGVGLCQWGARHLALRGLNHGKILDHYYPGSTLEKNTNSFFALFESTN